MNSFLKLHYFSDEQPAEHVLAMTYFKAGGKQQSDEYTRFQQIMATSKFRALTGLVVPLDDSELGDLFSEFCGEMDEAQIEDRASRLENEMVRRSFRLQALLLNTAVSQVAKVQLSQQVEQDLDNLAFTEALEDQIYRFYCFLLLAEYRIQDNPGTILSNIKQFIGYLERYAVDDSTYEIMKATNYFAFPYNLVRFFYFQQLLKAGELEQAYGSIKGIPNLRAQEIQTLVLMGRHNRDAALEIVNAELNREGASVQQRSEYTTLKGEILDDKTFFEQALALYERNARAQRDLGLYYMTAFKQQKLSVDEQKEAVKKAIEHLTKGWSLQPSDKVCRENLGQLLLITRTGLQMCLDIFTSLNSDYPNEPTYLQNLAMTYYALGDKKRSMDLFIQSLKCDNQTNIQPALQALRLAQELADHELTVFEVHFVMSQLANRFNLYMSRHQFESSKEEVTFAMNYIWQINESVDKMGNWLIDCATKERNAETRKRQAQPLKQLIGCYLQIVQRYAGTTAGDECIMNYLRMMSRIEELQHSE